VRALAYRPTDNVLLVGTHGNGMYYTYLGTPNFVPKINTPVNPVLNDRSFIRLVYPTVTAGLVHFRIGNINGLNKIDISITSANGQLIRRTTMPYRNGRLDINGLAAGAYILSFNSSDGRYRHVEKLIKQ
jgi:hypothetical protein